ncbi:MAG: hypothetical protein ACPHVV_02455, partial [Porticoccaceae bacterium]
SGNPEKKIMQDEFYIFTPLVKDIERNKLKFFIKNKPNWANFDSRTGSLSGRPENLDVGISKNITISVMDSNDRKVTLAPFAIEVINTNDKPSISGTPDETIELGKVYKFTPKVKDIDLDIAKDTLLFSITNKPRWATFNQQTGTLTGNPIAYQEKEGLSSIEIEQHEEIIITVTDSYGASDSLKPFIINIDHIPTDRESEAKASIRTSQISTTDEKIHPSHFDTVINNPNQNKAKTTSLMPDNNNLSQQIEQTDKTIKSTDPPIDETTDLDDELNDNSLAQKDKDTEDKTETTNQSDDLNHEKESLAEANDAVDKDHSNETPSTNTQSVTETEDNSNQQIPVSNIDNSEPETVVAAENQTNSTAPVASNETSNTETDTAPNANQQLPASNTITPEPETVAATDNQTHSIIPSESNETSNTVTVSDTGANSNQQASVSNTVALEPETVVAADNQINSIAPSESNETPNISTESESNSVASEPETEVAVDTQPNSLTPSVSIQTPNNESNTGDNSYQQASVSNTVNSEPETVAAENQTNSTAPGIRVFLL